MADVTPQDVPLAPVESFAGDLDTGEPAGFDNGPMEALGASVDPTERAALLQELGLSEGSEVVPSPAHVATPVAAAAPQAILPPPPAAAPQAQLALPPEFLQMLELQAQRAEAAERRWEERERAEAEARRPKKEPRKEDPNVAAFRGTIHEDLQEMLANHPDVVAAREARAETAQLKAGFTQFLSYQKDQAEKARISREADQVVTGTLLRDRADFIPADKRVGVQKALRDISLLAGIHTGRGDVAAGSQFIAPAIDALVEAEIARRNASAKGQIGRVAAVGGRPAAQPAVATQGLGRKLTRAEVDRYYGGDAWLAVSDEGRRIPRA